MGKFEEKQLNFNEIKVEVIDEQDGAYWGRIVRGDNVDAVYLETPVETLPDGIIRYDVVMVNNVDGRVLKGEKYYDRVMDVFRSPDESEVIGWNGGFYTQKTENDGEVTVIAYTPFAPELVQRVKALEFTSVLK